MRLAIDMSSFMWTSLLVGKDREGIEVNHNGRDVWVNTAQYGYENLVNMMTAAMRDANATPIDVVMVFEGKDSKRKRCMLDPLYKSGDSRAPEQYIQFNLLKENIKKTFRDLGAIAVSQAYVEGDDVLGYLAKNVEEDLMIATNDNDLVVLNGTNEYGAKVQVRIDGQIGFNKYGPFETKLVTLYKALVGDTSDKIKGVKGFGPAAWLNVNARYEDDGCFELMDLIHRGRRDEVAEIAEQQNCKFLKLIVEHWVDAVKCLKLATIHDEWVNTIDHQLEWEAGVVISTTTDERLKMFRASKRLVTAETYDKALAFLKEKLKDSATPSFDIETSTPDESDEWLAAQGDPEGVDQLGSVLTGFSITFGQNLQYTYYVPVDHYNTDNVSMVQARQMIECLFGKPLAIQNTMFELTVLYQAEDEDGTKWCDAWAQYGERGFIPHIRDTKIEASYVDENQKNGLKQRSAMHLGYQQVDYNTTVTKTGRRIDLYPGGRVLGVDRDPEGIEGVESPNDILTKKYKMRELPATEVFDYGADDTITTAALHNFYKFHMQLDHHWSVYLDVELGACYLHAKSFLDGITYDMAKGKVLEGHDKGVYAEAWATLRTYLLANGWDGTIPPVYTENISVAEMKEAYKIVKGIDDDEPDEDDEEAADVPVVKDAFLTSRVRTPAKLIALLKDMGEEHYAAMLEICLSGGHVQFTEYVQRHFTGEPKFKASNKQMVKLLYEVMKLPIVVRNKPTAKMKAAGIKQGNPKGDAKALAYALRDGPNEIKPVLEAIKLMQMVRTRDSLYYSKYPYFVHWKTGRIHPTHNQCGTNTRRASEAKPNKQQLPKHQKIEGQPARFRETILPHKKNAVVVSMDFESQELRIIADYSQDQNMLACFVGDNLKDMHALTGVGILMKKFPKDGWSYEVFMEAIKDEGNLRYKTAKQYRSTGKTVNFATEYGAMAEKISITLLVDEDEAQTYIDAKEEAFPQVVEWKENVIKEAKLAGTVRTKLGAVRHLAALFSSDDRFTASKAERQSVNFKVQGSAAEMTKKAEARMWEAGVFSDYDAVCYGPVHDEVVASCIIDDLFEFIPKMHACMVGAYADMQVPIGSSISFGPSFGVQIEIGNRPTREAIQAGLDKFYEMEVA